MLPRLNASYLLTLFWLFHYLLPIILDFEKPWTAKNSHLI